MKNVENFLKAGEAFLSPADGLWKKTEQAASFAVEIDLLHDNIPWLASFFLPVDTV